MKKIFILLSLVFFVTSCATITNDPNTPISMSFSDNSKGTCYLDNKRGSWVANLPGQIYVRRSDDALKFRCSTEDGREAFGSIPSKMGGKIVASAVFLDLGITDAITDKHREYPLSYVVPIQSKSE